MILYSVFMWAHTYSLWWPCFVCQTQFCHSTYCWTCSFIFVSFCFFFFFAFNKTKHGLSIYVVLIVKTHPYLRVENDMSTMKAQLKERKRGNIYVLNMVLIDRNYLGNRKTVMTVDMIIKWFYLLCGGKLTINPATSGNISLIYLYL